MKPRKRKRTEQDELSPEVLLGAYASGMFPMAVPELGNDIYWFAPDPRTIIPLDGFHVSKNLARTVRQQRFEVVSDLDFEGVIRACAAPRPESPDTWISEDIVRAYTRLFDLGFGHSVECRLNGELVGGLYGVALGGAFFGESMFHTVRDASKVALYYLVAHLRNQGFQLLDVQYTTSHLLTFGAKEIARSEYEALLSQAIKLKTGWGWPGGAPEEGESNQNRESTSLQPFNTRTISSC